MPELDYQSPQTPRQTSVGWDTLEGLSLVLPFVTLPAFFVGTVALEDRWGSWRLASLVMAVPTGLVTCAGFVGALHALLRAHPLKRATFFAVTVNGLALGIIAVMTFGS